MTQTRLEVHREAFCKPDNQNIGTFKDEAKKRHLLEEKKKRKQPKLSVKEQNTSIYCIARESHVIARKKNHFPAERIYQSCLFF